MCCLQCTVVHIYICFVTAKLFMSPESHFKVLCAASKPYSIYLRQSRPYQPRACFLFRLWLGVDSFLRWPALKSFSWTHHFQLGNTWKSYSSIVTRISRSSSQFCHRHRAQKFIFMLCMSTNNKYFGVLINCTVSIDPLIQNQAWRTLA